MRYVIAYDITDDAARLRVAEVLEGFGERVQRSVFECELVGDALEILTDHLRQALGAPDLGQIRVYRLCADCFQGAFGLGGVEPAGAEPAIVV